MYREYTWQRDTAGERDHSRMYREYTWQRDTAGRQRVYRQYSTEQNTEQGWKGGFLEGHRVYRQY
jgi:hypothetical protein